MSTQERLRARHLSRFPYCNGQAQARSGRSLAVSVRQDHAALWEILVTRDPVVQEQVDFVADARESASQARRLVLREFGALRPETLVERPPPRLVACEIVDTGPSQTLSPLEGPSFGLAQALAIASDVLQQPLDPSVAALAAVGPRGGTQPVDGLELKLRALEQWAPCIRAVLVANSQTVPETPLRVVRVSTVSDALDQVLSQDAVTARVLSLSPKQHVQLGELLFVQALRGAQHVSSWTRTAQLAAALQESTPEPAPWTLRAAHAIARRHAAEWCRVPLDGLDQLPFDQQLQLVAHAVQGASDAARREPELIERAVELVARADGHGVQLALLGALGRYHAGWHDLDRAVDCLSRACAGWFTRLDPPSASQPMCEWIRILGASNNPAALDTVLQNQVDAIQRHALTSDLSKAFVALACGRALLDTDQPGRASVWLAPDYWTSPALEQALLRQRLRLHQQGGPDRPPGELVDPVQLALHRLDHGDPSALAELRSRLPRECARIERYAGAHGLVRWWRY